MRTLEDTLDMVRADVFHNGYYTRRQYGKYTIYNKEGWRVAWGLNKKEMENYMKLLKVED